MARRHLPALLLAGLIAPGATGATTLTAERALGDDLTVALDAERAEVVLLERREDGIRALRPLPPRDRPADGLCAIRRGGLLDLFVGDGEGHWEQWSLQQGDAAWSAHEVRTVHTGPDSELCAISADGHWLFLSEENVGIWALGAGAEAPASRVLLEHLPDFEPEALVAGANGLHWTAADGTLHAVELTRLPPPPHAWPVVRPRHESATVARFGDAADDPAIYSAKGVHLVLATDKQGALMLLDAEGELIERIETGRLNNVDLRRETGGTAIVAATDRTHGTLAVFRLDPEGPRLIRLQGETPLDLADPYGLCLYRDPAGTLGAFANDTDGRVVHVALAVAGDRVRLEPRAAWQMGSQTEGCVVDDDRGLLWLGEEARGVWRFPLDATSASVGELVIDAAATPLVPDVEGLARLRDAAGRELLLVSSQGDDSYALFDVDRAEAHWLGSFRIGADLDAGLDGASETDGLELHPSDLGGRYPGGVLVVQDGRNRMPDAPQNFKFVALEDVLHALDQSRNASSSR
ncbi:MAG: phytase [Pseudomonadales bacterium]|jgi:3-phytase|nr:phytase [Pseudomonadales bacterium]